MRKGSSGSIELQPAYKPGSVLPFARERLSFISSYCHQ